MQSAPYVSVRHFAMTLGGRPIVRDVSFDVLQGEIFGLLGANGSGKTTTIRALLGMYLPTAGELLIEGQPFSLRHGRQLGYLPEERGLYRKERVLDTMVYFGQLKGMPRVEARSWSVRYLDRVELGDKAHLRLDRLSGGQQQKVQLGVTMMNEPSLLILDEPTKGFDPVNRRLLLDIVEERRAAGATVILVTHQMEEVERLCNRVVLLKDGQRQAYGTVAEIRAEFTRGQERIRIGKQGRLPQASPLFSIEHENDRDAIIIPTNRASVRDVFTALGQHRGLTVTSFVCEQASLDDIFVAIYGQERSRA